MNFTSFYTYHFSFWRGLGIFHIELTVEKFSLSCFFFYFNLYITYAHLFVQVLHALRVWGVSRPAWAFNWISNGQIKFQGNKTNFLFCGSKVGKVISLGRGRKFSLRGDSQYLASSAALICFVYFWMPFCFSPSVPSCCGMCACIHILIIENFLSTSAEMQPQYYGILSLIWPALYFELLFTILVPKYIISYFI